MFANLRNTVTGRKRNRPTRGNSSLSMKASKDFARMPEVNLRDDEARADHKCQRFKQNLGKLLRAHDHNWKRVPMFFFVDEWISDDGKTISKNRLKQAEKARRKFGIGAAN